MKSKLAKTKEYIKALEEEIAELKYPSRYAYLQPPKNKAGLYGASMAELSVADLLLKDKEASAGLKDHQIQELVNMVRDACEPLTKHQCLRGRINTAVVQYLEGNHLRIDGR